MFRTGRSERALMSAFSTLGVPSDASERDIKRAYARLLKQHHPEDEPEKFREIRAAYERALAVARRRDADLRSSPLSHTAASSPADRSAPVTVAPVPSPPSSSADETLFREETETPPPSPLEPAPFLVEPSEDPPSRDTSGVFRPQQPASPPIVPPAELAEEYLASLRGILNDVGHERPDDLFRHRALRSLEAKAILFHSAFSVLVAHIKEAPEPLYELLYRLDELFHWTADELLVSRLHPANDANLVFDLLHGRKARAFVIDGAQRALTSLRWHLMANVVSAAVLGAALGVWSVLFPH